MSAGTQDSMPKTRRASTGPPPLVEGQSTVEPIAAGPAPDDEATLAASSSDESPVLPGLPRELHHHLRYRVVAILGTGGMGTVYRAEHRLMDRPVALKVIRGDLLGNEAMVERFRASRRQPANWSSNPKIPTSR